MLNEDQLIEARNKLAAGRITAYRTMPYYARALLAIEIFEREGLNTFGVDKHWRLYYDPQKCLEWTVDEIAAVWLHEVNHLIRKHNERWESLEGTGHDHEVFNSAADASINTDLKSQGIILPNPERRVYIDSKLSPKWNKKMTAEQLYWEAIGTKRKNQEREEKKQKQEDARKATEASESDDELDQEAETPELDESGAEGSSTPSDDENEDNVEEESEGDSSKDENGEPTEGSESDDSDSTDEDNDSDSDSDEESDDESLGGNSSEDSEGENDEGEPADSDSTSNNDGDSESEDNNGDNETPKEGESSSDSDESGESEGSAESGESTSSEETGEDSESADDANGGVSETDCGSCAGGEQREYEEPTEKGAIDPASAEWIRHKTAEDIVDYAERNPGSIPGDVLREAKYIIEPQVDWREEFRSFFRRVLSNVSGYHDYTYSRPSRRGGSTNVIMPSLRAPAPPEIAAVLDTSGSMREEVEIAAALGELEELLARFGQTNSGGRGMHIVSCDAGATDALVKNLREFKVVGGGGTDMRVGIEHAANLKPRMDVIVTVTDGGTPWPEKKPIANLMAHYVVLLVMAKDGWGSEKNIPEWMHVIKVQISDRKRAN